LSLTTHDTTDEITTRPRLQADAREGDSSRPVLAVVVPCLNEELVVEQTAARLIELLERLIAAGKIDAASFVYFVDDGSRDKTWNLVEALHLRDERVKGLKLARNVGTQNALLAGLLNV